MIVLLRCCFCLCGAFRQTVGVTKKDVSCVFESVGFSLKYCSACTSDQQGALTETHCKEVYEILMFFLQKRTNRQ